MTPRNATWLLLHGTPLTPAVWTDVARLLGPDEAVVMPDLSHLPGHPTDQRSHARRLLARLSGRGPLHVVGHSFGGQVALDVAIGAPAQVRSLTILCSRDTPFPAFTTAAETLRRTRTIDLAATTGRWFTASEIDAAGPVVRYARRCLTQADPSAWADDLDAIATYERTADVTTLEVPTTLIAARQDQVATVDAMTDLAGRLRHSTLHTLLGSHMSPFTEPARLVELLTSSARADL